MGISLDLSALMRATWPSKAWLEATRGSRSRIRNRTSTDGHQYSHSTRTSLLMPLLAVDSLAAPVAAAAVAAAAAFLGEGGGERRREANLKRV